MDITALFNLSYGLYIVSAKDGDRNVGCVVNSVTQISATPATLAISINKDNYTNPCILKTGKFAVTILSEKVNPNVIGTFGFSSSKNKNKFNEVSYKTLESGLAIPTDGVCSYIECSVINQLDCFTHTIVVAEITDAQNIAKEPPMTYDYYHKVIKGKAPKNAPTYVDESKLNKKEHVCQICGYTFDGSTEEFNNLPDTYTCPVCSAPKSKFS